MGPRAPFARPLYDVIPSQRSFDAEACGTMDGIDRQRAPPPALATARREGWTCQQNRTAFPDQSALAGRPERGEGPRGAGRPFAQGAGGGALWANLRQKAGFRGAALSRKPTVRTQFRQEFANGAAVGVVWGRNGGSSGS